MTADFSLVTRQAIRQWSDIFEVLKGKRKTVNPEFLAKSKKLKRNKEFFRQIKTKGIQHPQIYFTNNVKGSS